MNGKPRSSPCSGEGKDIRAFPHLRGERRADKELLKQLPPDARRNFEALLETQYDSDVRQDKLRARLQERVTAGRPRRRPRYPAHA